MKNIITIFFLLFSFQSYAQNLTDTIHWRPNYKLTWQDFKGQPNSQSRYAAISYCSISYTYYIKAEKLIFSVNSFFYRDLSWTKDTFSTNGLAHEQGHFDINEIFAQKLKAAFSKYILNKITVDSDLKRILQTILTQRDELDELYDMETKYSFDREKQIEWNGKIGMLVANEDEKGEYHKEKASQ